MASDIQTNISGKDAPHAEAPLGEVILRTEGLTKHYGGVHALVDCNFEIRKGEHVPIMGDNGAGKSTFVRQITAVEQRTSRQDLVRRRRRSTSRAARGPRGRHRDGVPDPGARRRSRRARNLFLGREKIKFNLGPFSILDYKGMREATIEGLKKTGVKIRTSQHHPQHVGGQRQCVAIARTATFPSKLTIMDEPTAALGVQETAQVENIIRTLKERASPLILISHNMRQVMDLCDRIVVLRRAGSAPTFQGGATARTSSPTSPAPRRRPSTPTRPEEPAIKHKRWPLRDRACSDDAVAATNGIACPFQERNT